MKNYKSKNVNINDIRFNNPKTLKIMANITLKLYDEKLDIQTPRMLSLFGLNIYKDEKTDLPKSITLVLQFNSEMDKKNRVDNFLKKIKKLDKYIIDEANNNHKKWLGFKTKLNKDAIDHYINHHYIIVIFKI